MAELTSVALPALTGPAGDHMAAHVIAGAGPSGEDLSVEVDAAVPENAVGCRVFSVPFAAIPVNDTVVRTGAIALATIFLVNFTEEFQELYIDDNAGTIIVSTKIPPGERTIRFGGTQFAGLRWRAPGGSINGAVLGYTA
jgi:hypothetical protein